MLFRSTMDSCPEPEDMCMPEKSAPLTANGEIVHKALPRLNRTLRYVCRAIGPTGPQLSNAVPDQNL